MDQFERQEFVCCVDPARVACPKRADCVPVGYVWTENSFDALVADEWVVDTQFSGSVYIARRCVKLTIGTNSELWEHEVPRGHDLRKNLTDCLAAFSLPRE